MGLFSFKALPNGGAFSELGGASGENTNAHVKTRERKRPSSQHSLARPSWEQIHQHSAESLVEDDSVAQRLKRKSQKLRPSQLQRSRNQILDVEQIVSNDFGNIPSYVAYRRYQQNQ